VVRTAVFLEREDSMSTLGAEQPFFSTASTHNRAGMPLDASSAISAPLIRLLPLIEAAVDWITVAMTTAAACLLYQYLSARAQFHRSLTTNVCIALCIASLVTLLLANDGAYGGERGPLGIRQAERSLRVTAQAALLILFVTLMIGDRVSCTAIEICLLASILFLILQKGALTPVIAKLLVRDGNDKSSISDPAIASFPDYIISATAALEGEATRSDQRQAGLGYRASKRALDLAIALAAIALTSPLCLAIAILIRLDSPGLVIFLQKRVGKDGRIFTMYKFRSMLPDAPQYATSPDNSEDKRITRVGRILRSASLDELPQLFNVLKGEMSLVGPRPEMPFLVAENRAAHAQRLRAVPGMTGLWQLSPARAARIHENPHYDNYYVHNRTLSMDLAILLYTPVFLMRGI
jgi:lipopolysaccharide/colanic/teichoic acid biosynthesis glycosyltransferase